MLIHLGYNYAVWLGGFEQENNPTFGRVCICRFGSHKVTGSLVKKPVTGEYFIRADSDVLALS